MTREAPRPKRRLKHEFLALIPIVVLAGGVGLLFPYGAIGFEGRAPVRRAAPSCRFVELTEDAADRALGLVRSSLSVKLEDFRTMREDLLLSPLPERPAAVILSFDDRLRPAPAEPIGYEALSLPPSLAAPEPEPVAEEKAAEEKLPFPREELLKISE